jgi:hypothetical protein
MPGLRVISDAPVDLANDRLAFARYVSPIEQVLTDPGTQTPFTIGIFGAWGSGKSSVLRMVADALDTRHADKFLSVQFNPWVYRREPNMLVPLLHTLNDALSTKKQRFAKAIQNVGRILLALGSDILLKKLTADVVSLDKLSAAGKAIAQETGKVESEMRRLRTTLQAAADSVHEQGSRLVFFIDDLDRCQPDQIIDVLESVKLFLDLEHVFILLAVDKEVVDRGIQFRFKDFAFGKREKLIGAEYLEKMVQLPLSLYPLGAGQVGEFITTLAPNALVQGQLALLRQVVQPNPRKIKRVVNILSVAEAVAKQTGGLVLKDELLARLVVLQVQSAELHQEVIQMPDLLVALEALYQNKKKVGNEQDFLEFGDLRAPIQERCKAHYQPDSYLAGLLGESDFRGARQTLPLYLSMLGG